MSPAYLSPSHEHGGVLRDQRVAHSDAYANSIGSAEYNMEGLKMGHIIK
jgi:hypothetical protein